MLAYMLASAVRLVIDTNVLVSAVVGKRGGASREVLRQCLKGRLQPLMGMALFLELEEVLQRTSILRQMSLDRVELDVLVDAYLSQCSWVTVYYGWRPNLRDEGDQHLIELAVAGSASAIITKNVRHLKSGDLRFEDLRVLTPSQLLAELP